MLQLDQSLDTSYPNKLRPIKGYLFTYFLSDLTKAIDPNNLANYVHDLNYESESIKSKPTSLDLQDNDLCESICTYLNRAYKSLGQSLYVDILFNDINSDHYFEVYSEFNLRRLLGQVDKLKNELFAVNPNFLTTKTSSTNPKISAQICKPYLMSKSTFNKSSLLASQIFLKEQQDLFEQQLFQFNMKRLLEAYQKEELILDSLLKMYAEYYNNLTRPLNDSKELVSEKLAKYETKLKSQEKSMLHLTGQAHQSAQNSISQLKLQIEAFKSELNGLLDNIDLNFVDYKQNLVDLYAKLGEKISQDKKKIVPACNETTLSLVFDVITEDRRDLYKKECEEKRFQMLNIQLKMLERNKANSREGHTKKVVAIKLALHSLEETMLKKEMNKLKQSIETNYLERSIQRAIKEFESSLEVELKEFYKKCFGEYMQKRDLVFNDEESEDSKRCFVIAENEEDFIEDIIEEEEEDEYDDSKFQDAVEDPAMLIDQMDDQRRATLAEIAALKKRLLALGSKKSSLRLLQVNF
jgi:hypothetical protein